MRLSIKHLDHTKTIVITSLLNTIFLYNSTLSGHPDPGFPEPPLDEAEAELPGVGQLVQGGRVPLGHRSRHFRLHRVPGAAHLSGAKLQLHEVSAVAKRSKAPLWRVKTKRPPRPEQLKNLSLPYFPNWFQRRAAQIVPIKQMLHLNSFFL